VKLSLVPQEREFFRLFSEFAANLDKAAQLLATLMNDFHDAKGAAREMLELEHVGDKIVHDIVKRLNKTFVTPLDREDIYDLASTLDEILDSIEATADLMVLYRIASPTTHAVEQAAVLAKQTAVLRVAIDHLEKRKGLDDHWIEVNRLENDGDRLYRDAVAELFDGDMKCTDIIKWKDIYATLEGAMDQCEDVANILESIVLKNT
jgi:predicted phosphate transport protein (TIGR00153 family)